MHGNFLSQYFSIPSNLITCVIRVCIVFVMAEVEHQFVTILQFVMKQIGNKGKIQLSLKLMVSWIELYSFLDTHMVRKYFFQKKLL